MRSGNPLIHCRACADNSSGAVCSPAGAYALFANVADGDVCCAVDSGGGFAVFRLCGQEDSRAAAAWKIRVRARPSSAFLVLHFSKLDGFDPQSKGSAARRCPAWGHVSCAVAETRPHPGPQVVNWRLAPVPGRRKLSRRAVSGGRRRGQTQRLQFPLPAPHPAAIDFAASSRASPNGNLLIGLLPTATV